MITEVGEIVQISPHSVLWKLVLIWMMSGIRIRGNVNGMHS